MAQKKYDSTVARIAGNILSGMGPELQDAVSSVDLKVFAHNAVRLARAIVAEVERTEPKDAA